MSNPHVNISKQHPGLYQAAIDMSRQADAEAIGSGLAPEIMELVKLRVSQINGCAFCMRIHTKDALEKGASPDKVAVVPGWRETVYFDDVEREALALAEQVTYLDPAMAGDRPPPKMLTAEQSSAIAWVTIAINAFNRIAVTSHYRVAPLD